MKDIYQIEEELSTVSTSLESLLTNPPRTGQDEIKEFRNRVMRRMALINVLIENLDTSENLKAMYSEKMINYKAEVSAWWKETEREYLDSKMASFVANTSKGIIINWPILFLLICIVIFLTSFLSSL